MQLEAPRSTRSPIAEYRIAVEEGRKTGRALWPLFLVQSMLVYGPIVLGGVWCLTHGEIFGGIVLLTIALGPWIYILVHMREEARTRERIHERRERRLARRPPA